MFVVLLVETVEGGWPLQKKDIAAEYNRNNEFRVQRLCSINKNIILVLFKKKLSHDILLQIKLDNNKYYAFMYYVREKKTHTD